MSKEEFDPPPSIGTHTAVSIVEVNTPHKFAVVSHDGNGEIGFHLFHADPSCYSTWKLSSKHPGPLYPISQLGPDQGILLLSDAGDNTRVWAYQYLDSVFPYSVVQPGGKVRGKQASSQCRDSEIAIVTDDWKMHRYHASSSGTVPSVILHDTATLQGVGNLVTANVFHSSDALLECVEPGKGYGLIWALKIPYIENNAVQFSSFSFYGQGIESPNMPLLGPIYWQFRWPVGGYSEGYPLLGRLLVTGMDNFLRIYYFPGTGSQWNLLKYSDGTQNPLADYYLHPSMVPWDVIAFSPGAEEFDGRGDLWIVGVDRRGGLSRTVKILRITPYIDVGQYTVQEDTTYTREEDVADVIWYRGSRRLIHLELERSGKLRIVLD